MKTAGTVSNAADERQPGIDLNLVPEGVDQQESDDQQRDYGQPGIGKQARGREKGVGIAYLDDEQGSHAQHHGQTLEAQVGVHDLLVPELCAALSGQTFLQEKQQAEQRRAEHEQHEQQMQAETDEKQPVLP